MSAARRQGGVCLLLALGVAAAGCKSGQSAAGGEPRLPPAKAEAVDAFRDGARFARLGPASYGRALERFAAATSIDGQLWEAWFDQGWILFQQRKYAAAIAPLERARAIVPWYAPAATLHVRALIEVGRCDEAADAAQSFIATIDKQRDKDGRLPPAKLSGLQAARVQLATAQRRLGRYDAALEALQKALRDEPRSTAALTGLALVYQQKGQSELADLVLRRALDVTGVDDKSKAETWNNLGLVALARRRDQEAFADFDRAAKLDPALAAARRNKATVYLDCGDYARAVLELQASVKIDPLDAAAWLALGVAQRGAGDLPAAQRAYERALDADPELVDAHYDLAVFYMDFKKEPRRAQAELEKFLQRAPSSHARWKDAQARQADLAKQLKPPAPAAPAPASPSPGAGGVR